MKIKNANGEIKHTPKTQAKLDALKEIKGKGKPKSIADLTARVEQIEKILGL